MKLALFFLLSFAVHATAFLVPISLNGRTSDQAITVTILPLESATEENGGSGGGRTAVNLLARGNYAKSNFNKPTGDSTQTASPAAAEKIPVEKLSGVSEKSITATAEVSTDGIPTAIGENVASGNGSGESSFIAERFGAGMGAGAGSGRGHGDGNSRAPLTQARYHETPQPKYPDSARREGKEGRVLLRVLVDEEGRTKAIEVNTSSGHDLLDRAAIEAIKKWRFVPARAGTKPIETWVKVPIEFQLSNTKP